MVLRLDGPPEQLRRFRQEAGGHRWQRVPPTERRGRVHTSTVTVAVLDVPAERDWSLRPGDLEEFTQRGSGAGGQHRNKTNSCVTVRHIPTGLQVRIDGRSQHANRRLARELLESFVRRQNEGASMSARSVERQQQVGSGQRGDKVRTYRVRDDQVADHRTDRKVPLTAVFDGRLDLLWH